MTIIGTSWQLEFVSCLAIVKVYLQPVRVCIFLGNCDNASSTAQIQLPKVVSIQSGSHVCQGTKTIRSAP
jgi:hypothetical protein